MKTKKSRSNVTINRASNSGSNAVRIVAIVLVAIMALACIFTLKGENDTTNPSAKAVVEIDINGDGKTEEVEIDESTRVFLVDTSGSNHNADRADILAQHNGYDVVIPFSTFVGQQGGNSYICTCLEVALSMGVKEVALFTDLECYPDEDWSAFDDKFYQNREVVIYLADNATAQNVNRFTEIAKKAFDSSNCTVKFIYEDGSEQIVFNAYGETEKLPAEGKDSGVNVIVEAIANGGNESNMLLFMVCMALVIALIVMSQKNGETIIVVGNSGSEDDVPEEIEEVFENKFVGLDASGSVADHYKVLVDGAKKMGKDKVTVFNDNVKEMSIDEAEKLTANGRTCGWTFLREAANAGHKDIAIFSDFEFNDTDKEPNDGELEFDSITIATPEGKKCDERVIAKICTFAKKEIKKVVIKK